MRVLAFRAVDGSRLRRREVLRLGVAGAGGLTLAQLLAACAPGAPAAAPSSAAATATAKPTPRPAAVKVQVGVQNVEFAGSIAEDTQGYLKNVNVPQELLAFGPNVQPVTVVAGGPALRGGIGGAD